MKTSYLTEAFQKDIAQRFPKQESALTEAFMQRLTQLRRENAGASKQKQRHLENQILPGIAAYETLQTVLPKEDALQAIHDYVEERAWKLQKVFLKLMRIPGLYRRVPAVFAKQTPKMFGETSSCATVSATATILLTATCIPTLSGIGRKPSVAAMTAAISASS